MKKVLLLCSGIILCIAGCETPQSPDFKLKHKVQIPLTAAKTYPFLGESGALIDTTTEDFDSLFTVDSDGLIRLSKEKEFDFGDLDGAIPEVDVDPVVVNSKVGPISLTDFSSASNLGTTSFTSITSYPAPLHQGDPISGGSTSSPINIILSTNYLVSATIKTNGKLVLSMTNHLGFDISSLSITLNAGTSAIGSTVINHFNHNTPITASLTIPAGTKLSDINVDIEANWGAQTMQADAGNLVIDDISGQNLAASQVKAAIGSQSFSTTGVSQVDDSKFRFTKPDHFIELKSGHLNIDITNGIDIGIKSLKITFPDIRSKSSNTPLVLTMNDIPSALNGGHFSKSFDLSGYRIYAQGNKINYTISAVSKSTQHGAGSDIRTINENDDLKASVSLTNLSIDKAYGIIKPQTVLLNDDDPSNGSNKLDLFNDKEAKDISIDGISDLSKQLKNITFDSPVLSAIYKTNLTANATVYAAIAGTNSDGKTVYLSGTPGGKYHVTSSEVPTELRAHGQKLTDDQLIKFAIKPSTDGSTITASVHFDHSNTNVKEFFSNLPTKIRFIGIARVNESGGEATISTPITFDPKMDINLPMHFSAQNASYSDTMDVDLSGLPGEDDDRQISSATITLNYTNGLPFGLTMSMVMLDENGNRVTSYPLDGQDPLTVQAASVNQDTKFVEEGGAATGKLHLNLSKAQLDDINQTRSIIIKINFNTPQHGAVKVRADDFVKVGLKLSAELSSSVD